MPSEANPARRASETRSFAATKRGVLALADWLRCWQVPAVVMEATSDYWKPAFYRLQAEGLECVLADAKQVQNLPGRPKRDPSDSAWLATCLERGAVTPCFVATPEFRLIRLHTRYRRDLTDERTREKNRAEKLLESAAVKLSSVVTDLHGVTGRDITGRLIAGDRDPKALARLARARARRKLAKLEQALEGTEFFTPAHAALLKTMLERIDWINAETGVDMTRFRTPGHLASWAGRTPLDKQSGARKGQRRHKRGNRYIGAVTGETAVAAGKTDTREGARHRRLVRTRGKAKPASPPATPRCASSTPCCPVPAPGTRTSAPAGTTASAKPPGGSATTSGPSAPWATRSPLPQAPARGASPHSLTATAPQPTAQTAAALKACPAEVEFSG